VESFPTRDGMPQTLEGKQKWEALPRLLLITRIALAAPARGGKATRFSLRHSSAALTAYRRLSTP